MKEIIVSAFIATTIIINTTVGNIYTVPINNPVFTILVVEGGSNNNTNLLKGIENAPTDRYLEANITVNGFKLTSNLAITNEQKEKGLSVKEILKENESMLFVFEKPAKHSFWMKDMKFPIDIIWLDSNGKVVHIEENLEPCTLFFICRVYTPNTDSQYVLETAAGFSQRHSLYVGTDIDFELLS